MKRISPNIITLSLILGTPVFAIDWTGPGNNFNNSSNWAGSTPGPGDTARFLDAGHPGGVDVVKVVNVTNDLTIGTLAFVSTVDWRIVTGSDTLTVENSIVSSSPAGGELRGNFVAGDPSGLLLDADRGRLGFNGGSLTGAGSLDITGGGSVRAGGNFTVSGFSEVDIAAGGELRVARGGRIAVDIEITGQLFIVGTNSEPAVLDDVTGTGDWVFNIVGDAQDIAMVDVGVLDIGSLDLDIRNSPSSASPSHPVILATYDSWNGNEFASVSGLGPGQRLVYDFMGTNTIAIVPEAIGVFPVLLGFFPVMFLRKRRMR